MEKSKRRISALDAFLIACIILCVLGVAIRLFLPVEKSLWPKESRECVITYEVSGLRVTSVTCFAQGTEFRLAGSKRSFGTVLDAAPSTTPHAYYEKDDNGLDVLRYSPDEGDRSLVDLRGSMRVSGTYDEKTGLFYLNGDTILTANQTYAIESPELRVTVTVTGVTP